MTVFEFSFSLFSLLLGLSLAEIFGGLARAIESWRRAPVGWLTPLLATLMIFDVVSFWGTAWFMREAVSYSMRFMLAATTFAGAYYVAAYLVFPRELATGTDLDEHYFSVRRPILAIMFVANVVQVAVFASFLGFAFFARFPVTTLLTGCVWALLIANMFGRKKRAATVLLLVTVAVYLVSSLM